MIDLHILHYNDYSSLLVFALGFNLYYIVVRKNDNNGNALFFKFLGTLVSEYLGKKILQNIQIIERQNIAFNFYKNSLKSLNFLHACTRSGKKIVNIISDEIEDSPKIEDSLKILSEYVEKSKYYPAYNNFPIVAFITGAYCLYILISAPYESLISHYNVSLAKTNLVLIFIGCLFTFHDLITEKQQISKVFIWTVLSFSVFIYLVLLITSWIKLNILFDKTYLFHNYWITILVCFEGFIFYIFFTIMRNIILLFKFYYSYWIKFSIDKKMKNLTFYKKKLDDDSFSGLTEMKIE